jgi:hypothetical protein
MKKGIPINSRTDLFFRVEPKSIPFGSRPSIASRAKKYLELICLFHQYLPAFFRAKANNSFLSIRRSSMSFGFGDFDSRRRL